MKMPRDINAREFIKLLKPYGYSVTRQTGSHIRLTTQYISQHHITVPNHDPIRTGTLASIIADIANHLQKPKEELLEEMFG